MSTFDDASLVFIPSGYKTSKAYSVKPSDGSGDLTFSRSNDTATRVASNGLIERVRTNLVLQSQAFNTTWTPDNGGGTGSITITANYAAAPDGTTTADRLQITRGTLYANVYQNPSTTAGVEYTASVYLKSLSGTPTVSILYDSVPYSKTLTTEWVRYSVSYTASGSTTAPLIGLFGGDSSTADILVWGYQLETGPVATDYIATTSAAVSVGPVANVPRLDYLNSSCPRLLLEPQRTNLVTYSEQFDNAAWVKNNTTISANFATSPSGNMDADKIIPSTGNTDHNVDRAGVSVSSNGTASVFLKQSGYTKAAIRSYFTGGYASFDLVNGTILASAGVTAKIENYGNGWYRCSVNDTGNASYGYVIAVLNTSNDPTATYVGDGTSGILAWGAQLEVGAYATSYIPTLGAAVTRGADACLTASVPSLIGQTEGTMFIEFERKSLAADSFFILSNVAGTTGNSYQNSIYIYQLASSTIVVEGYISNVQQFGFTTSALSVGTHKVAIAYKANDFALYIDGVQIGTDTSGNVTAMNFLTIGGGADVANHTQAVSQALLFKTRLSNSSLAELTSL